MKNPNCISSPAVESCDRTCGSSSPDIMNFDGSARSSRARVSRIALRTLAAAFVGLSLCSCQSPGVPPSSLPASWRSAPTGPVTLMEGDAVRLFFPTHPEFSSTQKIRADGKISLTGVGEIQAAGKSIPRLQSEIAGRYRNQVSDANVVTVTLESGGTPITVSVMGRISQLPTDRPTTLLQALLAAGVSTEAQNTRNVQIRRLSGGRTESYNVDMEAALEGKDNTTIYLQGGDVVVVEEQ